ncbi:hypothetical protein BV25DRAFT_1833258 [Artomyces pyxidatus]|uniref:Uncharacterized protein n=1 Tax=Artomyces pyxidatus TaxID=48021 RepID=A0ACB8SFS4_9AGAM|nr:hypothetical protein BV25DRAFT_1833258 [Artomyces pyxidatus]
MSAENLALQHDNKQLNALIKDYETTLETVMGQFRVRAHEVQEQELNLIRDFESRILARETAEQEQQLAASTTFFESLTRVSRLLRQTMRAIGGEDATAPPPSYREHLESQPEYEYALDEGEWDEVVAAEWALERECELARLEKENEMLRRLAGEPVEEPDEGARPVGGGMGAGMGGAGHGEDGTGRVSVLPFASAREQGVMLGGPRGTVGPFGTYKKMRGPG